MESNVVFYISGSIFVVFDIKVLWECPIDEFSKQDLTTPVCVDCLELSFKVGNWSNPLKTSIINLNNKKILEIKFFEDDIQIYLF